jgi:hypothetical protein
MKRIPDGAGRTLFVAALAAGIFAAFLVVTPKLTAAGNDAGTTAPSTTVTTTTPDAASTSTTAAATTTTMAPPTTTSTAAGPTGIPLTAEEGYDGTVRLTVYAEGPLGGAAWALVSDGDTVTWRLHVVNTTDQELWGVFAWLERGGRALCDDHHLVGFGETDCHITTTAYDDDETFEAWVDAWTTERQVHDRVFYRLRVD